MSETNYGLGEEREGSFSDWREWPFLIDGERKGSIERTGSGYRASVSYTGIERNDLASAFSDGKRQAEAGRGRFAGVGVNVEVKALAATDTKPSRLLVVGDGVRTEYGHPGFHEGATAAEWAVRRAMPDREPVYTHETKAGWAFRIY